MSIAAVIVIGLGIVFTVMYNSLISKRNDVDNALGGISAYLQKRSDLIPSIVATVKQYASHEEDLLTEITKMRSQLADCDNSKQGQEQSDSLLNGILGKIAVVVENYPDLKANQNFLDLQRALNEVEEQLSAARRTYNANVVRYNNAVEMIPTNIVAGIIGYDTLDVFKEKNAEVPDIKNLFNAA